MKFLNRPLLILFVLLFAFRISAQSPPPEGSNKLYAPYGKSYTPKGPFRVLVVFAGLEGFENEPPLDGWNNAISGEYQLPDFIDKDDYTMSRFFFNKESDFDHVAEENKLSISNIMNIMSKPNEDFKLMADIFSDKDGKPLLVTVAKKDYDQCRSFSCINRFVLEEMKKILATYDDPKAFLAKFDNRKNSPNYRFDNSKTTGDGIIDYVAVIYRYYHRWKKQPKKGMIQWSGSQGGYVTSSIFPRKSKLFGYKFSTGFVAVGSTFNALKETYLHETGHGLFDCPHYLGANLVAGKHFYSAAMGIGLTAPIQIASKMPTAWGRWHLGFIDPIKVTHDGIYEIGDFVTAGDAIMLDIPFSGGQHLWMQNHSGHYHPEIYNHVWQGALIAKGGIRLKEPPRGLLMYVEDISKDRFDTNILTKGANGVRLIHPKGNYDYKIDTSRTEKTTWKNTMYLIEQTTPNPIGGISPWQSLRYDFNGDGKIRYSTNYNKGYKNEQHVIGWEMVNGKPEFTFRGWGIDGAAYGFFKPTRFNTGDVLSMGTNPTIINFPKFNLKKDKRDPFYLNGLYVKIIEVDTITGITKIEIKFKQTSVRDDVRWTGDIILPNITEDDQPDLVLDDNKTILVDLSGVANKTKIHPETHFFVEPTTFTIAGDATVHLKRNAKIIVKPHSSLIIEAGAKIIIDDGAKIIIEEGGTLWLKGNNLNLKGYESKIILKGNLKTADNTNLRYDGAGIVYYYPTFRFLSGQNSRLVPYRYREIRMDN